ncbi:Integrase catalytic core protein [Phytophthora palmivora]|uniref:Integrase catalytic core protein n=1 Tax=Phytophthora palmivora TaxID=4796 RepID=A0A2P4XBR3_9STRA|nr:Integrase catalytic core protein [Phytophthora palmivora]
MRGANASSHSSLGRSRQPNGIIPFMTRNYETLTAFQQKRSVEFWELLSYVIEVDNMSATKALNGITSHEKLFASKPHVSDLHVCGSPVFRYVPKKKRKNKLNMKADPGIFLGYAKNSLDYRIQYLGTGNLVERRDVVFHEDLAADPKYVKDLINKRYFGKIMSLSTSIDFVSLPMSRVHLPLDEDSEDYDDNGSETSDTIMDDSNLSESDEGMEETNHYNTVLEDSGCESTSDYDNDNDFSGSEFEGLEDDVPAFANSDNIGTSEQNEASMHSSGGQTTDARSMCDIPNPTSVQEALASEHALQWKWAMDDEYKSLMSNQTWELVPRPKPSRDKCVNILSSLWVLALKRNEKGLIVKHKARLAIKGYWRKYGMDYLESYSPVVRIESVLLVLVLALLLRLDCRHIDFMTAFLSGVLEDFDLYMEQPEGYNDGTGRVCKLLKGLYGLKQASRIWNNTLHQHLVEIGFKKCTFDAGVHWKMGNFNKTFLTVYVDDIIIAAYPRDIENVVTALANKFRLKDLGLVRHLLGMIITLIPGKMLCISQTAYIDRMLKKFGLADAKSVRSPRMHNEPTLRVEGNSKLINDSAQPFREMVGSLQYLVHCTRPDLANAVRTLGRYGRAYIKENFCQAQSVMRYLRDTKHILFVYRYADIGKDGIKLDAFADADHAGCPETSR